LKPIPRIAGRAGQMDMDFLKIVKSIEELLYEVMAWLVFYPKTLWRVITCPSEMMKYSDVEQTEAPEQQYIDTLSPPLFLMLSILIAHAIEVAMHERIVLRSGLASELVQSHEYLLMLRAIAFSIVPLMFAVALLKGLGQKVDREKLRGPFYSQCYVAAPFALAFGLASVGMRSPFHGLRIAGVAGAVLAVAWYLWLQAGWLSTHLNISIGRAWLVALWTSAKAIAIIVAIALVLLL
jgi:hypothetical protein